MEVGNNIGISKFTYSKYYRRLNEDEFENYVLCLKFVQKLSTYAQIEICRRTRLRDIVRVITTIK